MRLHTLGLVSLKIVFNGREYDSVDAMPPDVRKEYELALETLRKSGGEEILSVLQRGGGGGGAGGGGGTHIKATVRQVVVNGKKYDSVDAMPPDVRGIYERALARGTGRRSVPTAPIVEDEGAARTPLWRVLMWVAVGVLIAWWLFHRG